MPWARVLVDIQFRPNGTLGNLGRTAWDFHNEATRANKLLAADDTQLLGVLEIDRDFMGTGATYVRCFTAFNEGGADDSSEIPAHIVWRLFGCAEGPGSPLALEVGWIPNNLLQARFEECDAERDMSLSGTKSVATPRLEIDQVEEEEREDQRSERAVARSGLGHSFDAAAARAARVRLAG